LPDFDPFASAPQTDREILRDLWHRTRSIEEQTKMTNGRVTRLERFMWAAGGGLLVISAIVVPLFVRLVSEQ
jgi:hypothetical protein